MEKMIVYLKPSYFYFYVSGILLAIGLICVFLANSVGAFVIFAIVAVLNSLSTFADIRRLNNTIRIFREEGKIDQILLEFETSRSFIGGELKMGNVHIFGRKSAAILSYQDITKVYQYIHKTNFAEDKRELRVETKDNSVITICKLKLRGKSDTLVTNAIAEMTKKNPNIKIGYK